MDSSPAVKFGCCLRPCGNHVSCYARPCASLPAEKSKEICWTVFIYFSLSPSETERKGSAGQYFHPVFYFWEASRMVTNTFLRMCWLMKSLRDLIFGGQSGRLGRWSRKSQQLWPEKDNWRSFEYSFLLKKVQDDGVGEKRKCVRWIIPSFVTMCQINETLRITCLFL